MRGTMGRWSLSFGGALALFLGSASGESMASCVQVAYPEYTSSCPCDGDFSFQMSGTTTLSVNTVNVVVIIDASGSVVDDYFDLEKDFAKNLVASFASQSLFDNGGAASFAVFSDYASDGGTFTSSAEYDAYVDNHPRPRGRKTDIESAVAKGRELLNSSASGVSVMIIVTDGSVTEGGDPKDEADAARAEGTVVYAVGVGEGPSEATLLAIGGGAMNVFDIAEFTELDSALEDIVSSTNNIPCAATGGVVMMQFNAMVEGATVDGGSVYFSGNEVVLDVPDLASEPTHFAIALDTCGEAKGTKIVASMSYTDDQGNAPNLSPVMRMGAVETCDDDFSYSYVLDPWYDDTTSVDPTVPGPAPHRVEPPTTMSYSYEL